MLQRGITVSVTYSSKKLQAKPFITFQKSTTKNYAPFLNTADAGMGMIQNDDPAANNINSRMGAKGVLKSTPAAFGGAYINYMFSKKLNINTTAYYNAAQTHDHASNLIFNDGVRGIDHINAKLILNANVSYELIKGLRFFCSGKNILNDKSREFFHTDIVPFTFLGGINYEL
jgi:iron complex outermembrane receptor protein